MCLLQGTPFAESNGDFAGMMELPVFDCRLPIVQEEHRDSDDGIAGFRSSIVRPGYSDGTADFRLSIADCEGRVLKFENRSPGRCSSVFGESHFSAYDIRA